MKHTEVTLKFPSQFSQFIDNQKSVKFEGEKISELINYLDQSFGNVKERICEENGAVRPYINLFLGTKNINTLQGLDTIIPNGESISLLLSRAGG